MPVFLNRLPNAGAFRNALVEWVEEHEAQIRSRGIVTSKGPELLSALAVKLRGLPDESQKLRSLQTTSSRLPKPRGSEAIFIPSPTQSRIAANVSNPASESSVDEILDELISAGTEDALVAVSAEQGQRAEREIAEARRQFEEDRDVKVAAAEDAADEAMRRFHHAEAELADARKRVEHLAAAVEGKTKPKAKVGA